MHYKKILYRLGKTETENMPQELVCNYICDRGAMEKRKALNDIDVTAEEESDVSELFGSF